MKSQRSVKALPVHAILAAILLVPPAFIVLIHHHSSKQIGTLVNIIQLSEFTHSLKISSSVALLTYVISLFFALFSITLLLWSDRLTRSKYLFIFLFPTIVGSMTIAFTAHVFGYATGWLPDIHSYSEVVQILMLSILGVLRFAPLALFIIYLPLLDMPPNERSFLRVHGLAPSDIFRDIVWPRARDYIKLASYYIVIGMIFEHSLFTVVFGKSATDAIYPLLAWWNQLIRQAIQVGGLDDAYLSIGSIIIFMGYLITLLIVHITLPILKRLILSSIHLFEIASSGFNGTKLRELMGSISNVISFVVSLFPALLFILCLAPLRFDLDWSVITDRPVMILFYILIALAVASFVTATSVLVAFYDRYRDPIAFATTRTRSFFFLLLLMLLTSALPPTFLSFTMFKLLSGIMSLFSDLGFNSFLKYLILFYGFVVRTLPMMLIFIYVMNMRVSSHELQYLINMQVGQRSIIHGHFVQRLRSAYVLILLFAFSTIWTSPELSSTFDTAATAWPMSVLENTVGGRTGYANALPALLTVMTPPLVFILFLIGVMNPNRQEAT